MRVCNDILLDMNKHYVVLLVFLDLSAAFDTVDHDVLLNCLEHRFGILDSALSWVRILFDQKNSAHGHWQWQIVSF